MILINKIIEVFSSYSGILLMLMFRLLLYGNEYADAVAESKQNNITTNGQVAKIYVAVVYPKSKESVFLRAVKQTMTSLSEDFTLATNLQVVPQYTALSEFKGYNTKYIDTVCESWNHKPVVAALIFASFDSAFGPALTALHNNIPVLWTTGDPRFIQNGLSRFEVRLDPGFHQVLGSLRSLLLTTHWHSFTVLHTNNLLSSKRYTKVLTEFPLVPTIIPFRSDSTTYYIFRLLTDVSKSTKGVIVLICDGNDAKRVLDESKRLSMVEGDFVWLWIDTDASILAEIDVDSNKISDPIKREKRRVKMLQKNEKICNGFSTNLKNNISKEIPRKNEFEGFLNVRKISESKNGIKKKIVGLKNDKQHLDRTFSMINGYEESCKNVFHHNLTTKKQTNNTSYIFQNERRKRAEKSKQTADSVVLRKKVKNIENHSDKQNMMMMMNSKIVKRTSELMIPAPKFLETTVTKKYNKSIPEMPVGLLAIRPNIVRVDKTYVRNATALLVNALKQVIIKGGPSKLSKILKLPRISCFDFHPLTDGLNLIAEELTQELSKLSKEALAGRPISNDTKSEDLDTSRLAAKFKILNLIPEGTSTSNNNTVVESKKWKVIGEIIGEQNVSLETIVWPGGDIIPVSTGRASRSVFRIVTAFAPPFVMLGEADEDGQCLRGIECHRFLTSDKDNLTLLMNEIERNDDEETLNTIDGKEFEKINVWDNLGIRDRHPGQKFTTNCCYGLSMDLLENVAMELEFDFQLYVVADGLYGAKKMTDNGEVKWNGIVGDLVSGAAHMSFSALSVSSSRAQVIEFSVPYFFSGVSFLSDTREMTDIPLLAFLLPFSPSLWVAVFISMHVTAFAAAIYEWLSPFGLNPWGRQRSKNFGLASAMWVVWSLLCGHLIQFKAPKSWPNKFLINVWGGFSVIFIASYTANIAALIAGFAFYNIVGDHHDRSLLQQRVGAPESSAAEFYVRSTNERLWSHMRRYTVPTIGDGVKLLKNNSLDILIADTPILEYYRATDHGCKLQKVGDTINEDTYAIGMTRGFPLKDSISAAISKYASNGYMDILQEKWYGGLPCFKLVTNMGQPKPLGVPAVSGAFLMLVLGMVISLSILFIEHVFYRYALPSLRNKPKESIWRSRNVMFFSQKLYRFINCVELVSPHHAARELVHTLRQGQITSLFQKSVKRKEHEQRQQHKNKAQLFEMIQEIRRVQQEERNESPDSRRKFSPKRRYYRKKNSQVLLSPSGLLKHRSRLSPYRLNFARRLSRDIFRSKSSGNLELDEIEVDINMATGRMVDFYTAQAIGRRLSRGNVHGDNSPPDMNTRRSSQLPKDDTDTASPVSHNSPTKIETSPIPINISTKIETSPTPLKASSKLEPPPISINIPNPEVSKKFPLLSPSLFGAKKSFSLFSRDIGSAARKFNHLDNSSFRAKSNTSKSISPTTPNVIIIEHNDDDDDEPKHKNETNNVATQSSEHIIEIVLPSRKKFDECDDEKVVESKPYDGLDIKPKITLHLPNTYKCPEKPEREILLDSCWSRSSSNINPILMKLSHSELLNLNEMSEKDLKYNIKKALEQKEVC